MLHSSCYGAWLSIVLVPLVLCTLLVSAQEQPFSLVLVRNATSRSAVCNDGTPAGYYFRASSSKSSVGLPC
jgi:hypothetical protein